MNTYKCDLCDYECKTKGHYKQHCSTIKHTLKLQGKVKERIRYHCRACDFLTYYKDTYTKHCKSKKHAKNVDDSVYDD